MRIQKPIRGYTRRRFSTSVINQIERAIERECKRYGVSRSFVIANALAFTFNIEAETYTQKENVVKFRKRRA